MEESFEPEFFVADSDYVLVRIYLIKESRIRIDATLQQRHKNKAAREADQDQSKLNSPHDIRPVPTPDIKSDIISTSYPTSLGPGLQESCNPGP
jgi:hypothetical protein